VRNTPIQHKPRFIISLHSTIHTFNKTAIMPPKVGRPRNQKRKNLDEEHVNTSSTPFLFPNACLCIHAWYEMRLSLQRSIICVIIMILEFNGYTLTRKPLICYVIQLISKYLCDLAEYKILVGCLTLSMHLVFSRDFEGDIFIGKKTWTWRNNVILKFFF